MWVLNLYYLGIATLYWNSSSTSHHISVSKLFFSSWWYRWWLGHRVFKFWIKQKHFWSFTIQICGWLYSFKGRIKSCTFMHWRNCKIMKTNKCSLLRKWRINISNTKTFFLKLAWISITLFSCTAFTAIGSSRQQI